MVIAVPKENKSNPETNATCFNRYPINNKTAKIISKAVAKIAKTSPTDFGTKEFTELEYSTKFCQLPQTTPTLPGSPQKPNRSATADKKENETAILKKSCEKVSVFDSIFNCFDKQISAFFKIKKLM